MKVFVMLNSVQHRLEFRHDAILRQACLGGAVGVAWAQDDIPV
jgi:hypothetical protein